MSYTALLSGIVYITATVNDGSGISATCEIITNYPRTGWVANIDYTASVNVRKNPNTSETVTTARYGNMSDAGKMVLRKLELNKSYGDKCGL